MGVFQVFSRYIMLTDIGTTVRLKYPSKYRPRGKSLEMAVTKHPIAVNMTEIINIPHRTNRFGCNAELRIRCPSRKKGMYKRNQLMKNSKSLPVVLL